MANIHPQIIKKVKKSGGAAHHGGAWKVAYADFVTAMMAFFLLMWLLNATTEEQKRGISNYFGPVGLSDGASGSGGVLGGLSISSEGAFQDSKSSPAITMLTPQSNAAPTESETSESYEEKSGQIDKNEELTHANDSAEGDLTKVDNAEDTKHFQEVADKIKQAIQESPELKQLADNIIVDQTPEGLRIQLVDQDRRSMFPLGETKMYDYTAKLLDAITGAIQSLPNKISISGHTDAKPYVNDKGYSNWELSADRANSSRRVLIESGLDPSRISKVIGRADTDPLLKANPMSSQNRRITIVLLKTTART